MSSPKQTDQPKGLQNLSGEVLELAYSEIKTSHEAAVEVNTRLREETQQTLSIAAIVISITVSLSAPTTTISRLMIIVAIVLLVAAVLSSFIFLFNRPPSRVMDLSSLLGTQDPTVTVDTIRRHQIARALELNEASHKLLRQRVLQVNLIKAALASSVIFLGAGYLAGLL